MQKAKSKKKNTKEDFEKDITKVLNILYYWEDFTQYQIKQISKAINLLQEL